MGAIRGAIAEYFPSLSSWVRWFHSQAAPVHLPSGDRIEVNRGVEQGDPLGGIQAAAVILDVMAKEKCELDGLSIRSNDSLRLKAEKRPSSGENSGPR